MAARDFIGYPPTLYGEGHLHAALVTELQQRGLPIVYLCATNGLPTSLQGHPVISIFDWCDRERDGILQSALREQNCLWLPLWLDCSTLWAGPWIMPMQPGCLYCLEERLARYAVHAEQRQAAQTIARQCEQRLRQHHYIPTPLINLLAELIRDEWMALCRRRAGRWQDHILYWDLFSLQPEWHAFQPLAGCAFCSPLPEDQAALAGITLQAREKVHSRQWRVTAQSDLFLVMSKKLVSSRIGLIRNINAFHTSLMMAAAPVPVPGTSTVHLEAGVGRATTAEQARKVALLEAFERYAGFMPGGKRPCLRASYRALREQALDPRQLILFTPTQYAAPGFRFVPFDEERRHLWVWAYSFKRQQPVAIPEEFAYYGPLKARGRTPEEPLLLYDLSNGCALGNCLEEAILHALFEVLERDAFLLTWYARQSPQELDLESVQDRRILLLADRLGQAGYELHMFNITQEFAIPCVWAMAIGQKEGTLTTISAAGCHLDPEQAIQSAIIEIMGALPSAEKRYQQERAYALQMLEDSTLVHEMHDHMLVYALPEAFERMQFLLARGQDKQPLTTVFPGYTTRRWSSNLTADVQAAIDAILQAGLDVLVFDQTTQEQVRFGLHTVRVLVPGALPMAFGYQQRRYAGCERLLRLLHLTPETDAAALEAQVNPWPHPFP